MADMRFTIIDIYRQLWPEVNLSARHLDNFLSLIPVHLTPKDLEAGAQRAKEWWDDHLIEGKVKGIPQFTAIVSFAIEEARKRGLLAHMYERSNLFEE